MSHNNNQDYNRGKRLTVHVHRPAVVHSNQCEYVEARTSINKDSHTRNRQPAKNQYRYGTKPAMGPR